MPDTGECASTAHVNFFSNILITAVSSFFPFQCRIRPMYLHHCHPTLPPWQKWGRLSTRVMPSKTFSSSITLSISSLFRVAQARLPSCSCFGEIYHKVSCLSDDNQPLATFLNAQPQTSKPGERIYSKLTISLSPRTRASKPSLGNIPFYIWTSRYVAQWFCFILSQCGCL